MRLTVLFAALAGLTFSCNRPSEGGARAAAPAKELGKLEHVSAQDFKRLAEAKHGLFVDVRTPGEVARGHIPEATAVDINDSRFEERLERIQKDRPIFVYCASGARSSAAAELMIRKGFTEVFELAGGIGGWAREGYPIERSDGPPPSNPAEAVAPDKFDLTLGTEGRVLVDFHTPWCTPCRHMAPIIDAVDGAWRGKVKVVRVDVDQSDALATREKVKGVPTLVLYVDGKERWRKSGEVTRDAIEAELAKP
jgi:thioredoxin